MRPRFDVLSSARHRVALLLERWLVQGLDPEDRVIGRVGECGEELVCAPTPLLAIGRHHAIVLVTVHLDRMDGLVRPAAQQLALAGAPQVADPVGVAPSGNEVPGAAERERRDRRPDPGARCDGRAR